MPPRRLIVLACLLPAFALSACGDEETPAPESGTAAAAATDYTAAAKEAVGAVAAGAPLIDVRRQDEWDAGHAEGAQLLPLARIEAGELPELDKSEPVFVYCASGRRAGIAVKIMREAGFTDVTNIGGFTDWKSAGGPVAPS